MWSKEGILKQTTANTIFPPPSQIKKQWNDMILLPQACHIPISGGGKLHSEIAVCFFAKKNAFSWSNDVKCITISWKMFLLKSPNGVVDFSNRGRWVDAWWLSFNPSETYARPSNWIQLPLGKSWVKICASQLVKIPNVWNHHLENHRRASGATSIVLPSSYNIPGGFSWELGGVFRGEVTRPGELK